MVLQLAILLVLKDKPSSTLIFSVCMIFTLRTLWRFRLSICTLLVGKCCLQSPGTANIQEAAELKHSWTERKYKARSWKRKWRERDRKCMKISPSKSYVCVTWSLWPHWFGRPFGGTYSSLAKSRGKMSIYLSQRRASLVEHEFALYLKG